MYRTEAACGAGRTHQVAVRSSFENYTDGSLFFNGENFFEGDLDQFICDIGQCRRCAGRPERACDLTTEIYWDRGQGTFEPRE